MSEQTLYHGSIYRIEKIDVSLGKNHKDFGPGFYTAINRRQAVDIVNRNAVIETRMAKQDIKKYLHAYILELDELKNLRVKQFKTADELWVRFVLSNRSADRKTHSYDIVVGPTANDQTNLVLNLYFEGAYGPIDSDRAINSVIQQLEPQNLGFQWYFGTNRAAALLRLKEVTLL